MEKESYIEHLYFLLIFEWRQFFFLITKIIQIYKLFMKYTMTMYDLLQTR